jgi:subtilisin
MDLLPAWSVAVAQSPALPPDWPATVTREWAWGGSSGAGVRVCIIDSGVEAEHPRVGAIAQAFTVEGEGESAVAVPDAVGDVSGHGTACAGIIRALAPGCELSSVRVLGPDLTGAGEVLLAGLEWAVDQRFDVINLSLSTRKRAFAEVLHRLADRAYFARSIIVASAHNAAVESFPWRFPTVVSVGSHDSADPYEFHVNGEPPVDFFARGVELDVAWLGGGSTIASGNSFATPHLAGLCALILGAHPGLLPYELKAILRLTANNAA